MHLSLRVVVALLLAITVPIQGVVAAAMAQCYPATQHMAEAVSTQAGHDRAAMMGVSVHDHHQMAPHRQQSSTSANEPGRFVADLLHGGQHKVTKGHGGGTCCAVAAIPSRPLVLESVAQREFFAPFEPNGVSAFLTGGLERPPRFFLA